MAQHLKTRIFHSLECIIDKNIPASEISALHTRGVRYFEFMEGIDAYCGIMNERKEGRQYRKHIIVRRYTRDRKVFQLYTYHFPKTWSAACVANRELIKEAQRRAHALEHDTSRTGLEWHIRFLNHYFKVFKGHAKPEPGLKPYSRFYQYTYVAIYRELQAAAHAAQRQAAHAAQQAGSAQQTALQPVASFPALCVSAESLPSTTSDSVSFEPVDALSIQRAALRHLRRLRRSPFHTRPGVHPGRIFAAVDYPH